MAYIFILLVSVEQLFIMKFLNNYLRSIIEFECSNFNSLL